MLAAYLIYHETLTIHVLVGGLIVIAANVINIWGEQGSLRRRAPSRSVVTQSAGAVYAPRLFARRSPQILITLAAMTIRPPTSTWIVKVSW
jgi:hypothetical protein